MGILLDIGVSVPSVRLHLEERKGLWQETKGPGSCKFSIRLLGYDLGWAKNEAL